MIRYTSTRYVLELEQVKVSAQPWRANSSALPVTSVPRTSFFSVPAILGRHSFVDWIGTALSFGTGRSDGVLFRKAFEAVADEDWERLGEVAELAVAFRPTSEIATEQTGQGDAFLTTTRAIWPAPALDHLTPAVAHSVAVAAACSAHGITLEDSLLAYLHTFAANLVSAGVRLIPLGQTEGQAALQALEPVVMAARETALATSLDDLGTATPVMDWASMAHETQYTRLFRS